MAKIWRRRIVIAVIASFFVAASMYFLSCDFAKIPSGAAQLTDEEGSGFGSRIEASSSPLSGITVVVLNEAVSPSYFAGSLQNDYTSIITALSAEGATTTSVTSSQITSGALSGYDVFIMIDNAPDAACQSFIQSAWMAGTAIMAFDSSICALTYFGILPSSSIGSIGQGTYWEYGDTGTSRISLTHPITANYSVNAVVAGTSGDAMWLSSAMSSVSEASSVTVLTSLDGDASRWTTILYEPISYAPVFFCWDQEHVKNNAIKPMIIQAIKYLATSGNHAPLLTSGYVSPMIGTLSTLFTFTVTYTDVENTAPSYIWTYVGIYKLSMSKVSSSNYRDGCTYVTTWCLPAGSYTYHFEASDGVLNATSPTEYGPYVGTSPPTSYLSKSIITPGCGFLSTTFSFQVTYTHTGNIAPSYLYLTVDSVSYLMYKVSSYDNTYSDGCEYQLNTTLGLGSHTYSFRAFDGSTMIYSPVYTGLNVISLSSIMSLTQAACSPVSGDTNTVFQFRVLYKHAYNVAPSPIEVHIDGLVYSMSKESLSDTTFNDGCSYIYSTRLSSGYHTYLFRVFYSGEYLSTSFDSVDVRAGSIYNEPGSVFALVIIIVGSVATISTISIARKIKIKKAFNAPVHPNPASMGRQQSQSGNAMGWSSGLSPAHGGGAGVGAGDSTPITPRFLPASAFVTQPIALRPLNANDFQLQAPQGLGSSTPADLFDSRPPQVTDLLLPGSPKWMRLAQHDISMYTVPLGKNDVTVPNLENNDPGSKSQMESTGGSPDDILIAGEDKDDDLEPVQPEPDVHLGGGTIDQLDLDTGEASTPRQPAVLVVRLLREEGSSAKASESDRAHVVICPSCKKETLLDGFFESILYTCTVCKLPILFEVVCRSCLSKSEITQDDFYNAPNGNIRCPVCWEYYKV